MKAQRAAVIGAAIVLSAGLLSIFAEPLSDTAFHYWFIFITLYFALAVAILLLYPVVRHAIAQLSRGWNRIRE